MTLWHPLRTGRVVLAAAVVLGGTALAATPVGASSASAITCGPKAVTSYPAPGVGNHELFKVDSAGTVQLLQESNTTLRVTDADSNSGWKNTVITREGTRVHVGFQQIGNPNDQERFWARMNTTGTPGTVINVVIQSCT
jgi:hypothetical protein